MRSAAALCVLIAALLTGSACALPGEVVLRRNASNECVADWSRILNRTYPGWEYMVDATGKSLFDLGKYDQCRDLGRTVAQYCYVQYPIIVDGFPVPGALGLCAPASCTDDDLEFSLYEFETWVFGDNSSKYIHDSFVHCLPFEHPPLDGGAIAALVVVGIVVAFALAGTIFDYVTSNVPVTDDTEPLIGSINDGAAVRHTSDSMRDSGFGQFLLSFSVLWNIERLHQPHPEKKTAILNGMRVFSMFWVILGHSFLYGRFDYNHPIGYQNLQHVFDVEAHKWSFQLVFGAELAVDTFFYLSGFLVAWGALDMLFRNGKLNLILYYVHRYWRLTPVYAFCILIFACLQKYIADGPAWFLFSAGCDQWWANLLYITDFYPKFANICFGWGWYLSVDFHFYIFTPIVLYAYWYRKWIGWLLCCLCLIACWIVNGQQTYEYNLSYYPISPNFNDFANKIYNKPWTRMGPYVIGVMFAFFLQERKQRGKDTARVPAYILWPLYGAITLLLFWPVYGTKYLYDSNRLQGGFTKWGNVFYIALARSGWALGVGLLATLAYWGYGGIARWILEREIWTPMARLTYLAYLVHPMILIPIYGGARVYHVYSEFELTSKFAGNVSLAYATAFVVWLLVEKPTMNLEKFLLPAHGKKKTSGGH